MTDMLNLNGQLVCDHTGGEFATEPEAWADLDARLDACGLFKVYKEVWGFPIQPRLEAELKELRIDRLLIPLPKALGLGWKLGAVGIEAKCSGKKLGPLINQGLDYARAAWHLPLSHVTVMTSWTFLWPCSRFGGDLESVAVSNRIGVAYSDSFARLVLNVGGMKHPADIQRRGHYMQDTKGRVESGVTVSKEPMSSPPTTWQRMMLTYTLDQLSIREPSLWRRNEHGALLVGAAKRLSRQRERVYAFMFDELGMGMAQIARACGVTDKGVRRSILRTPAGGGGSGNQ